jgi:hypothetical protein
MRAFRPLLATTLVVVAFVVVVWFARRQELRAKQPPQQAPAEVTAPADVTPASAPTGVPSVVPPAPGETAVTETPAKLVLFFPGDDGMLHRELHDVPHLPVDSLPRIKLVMDELLAGSHSGLAYPVTWAADVQAVFLDQKGSAFVDLSPPPPDAVQGTDGELMLIYAIVNSIGANCPAVARTQILFGGREVSTLGHIDLSRPLAPMPELVAP